MFSCYLNRLLTVVVVKLYVSAKYINVALEWYGKWYGKCLSRESLMR